MEEVTSVYKKDRQQGKRDKETQGQQRTPRETTADLVIYGAYEAHF
jgi:hypothetical protein